MTTSPSVSAEEDARILLAYLAEHPEVKTAIAEAPNAAEATRQIEKLPQEGRRLLGALVAVPRAALAAPARKNADMQALCDWLLTVRAPLDEVARTLAPGDVISLHAMMRNPIASIRSSLNYYPSPQVGFLHLEFRGIDGKVLLENAVPVSAVAETAANMLDHVAGGFDQLRMSGCALGGHNKEDDSEILVKVAAALRQICRARGISLTAVMEEGRRRSQGKLDGPKAG